MTIHVQENRLSGQVFVFPFDNRFWGFSNNPNGNISTNIIIIQIITQMNATIAIIFFLF